MPEFVLRISQAVTVPSRLRAAADIDQGGGPEVPRA